MSYRLEFLEDALKEWEKLDRCVREQFKSKLIDRLAMPHVPASRLCGSDCRYKIKLRSVGYRLVYEVKDGDLLVVVIAVGKRNRNEAYRKAAARRLP